MKINKKQGNVCNETAIWLQRNRNSKLYKGEQDNGDRKGLKPCCSSCLGTYSNNQCSITGSKIYICSNELQYVELI